MKLTGKEEVTLDVYKRQGLILEDDDDDKSIY